MPTNELLLRTERLDLVAATLEHLEAELASPSTLDQMLGVHIPPGWPPGEYDRDALEFFHAQLKAGGPERVGWYTWYAITRNPQGQRESLVAGAGYLGPPFDGTAEIGYSVIPSARRNGFATEIVAALVDNAFAVPTIDRVIAHTSDANEASTHVLLRCGFDRVGPGPQPQSIRYSAKRTST
jgi:RimJ/RimL family protein N-acetyltransferase